MASQLLIDEPPLQLLPSLAEAIGLNQAIVAQQVHYWLNPRFNQNLFEGRYWVHNTYERWHQQFPFWSLRTVRRTIISLEEASILISRPVGHVNQIKCYTLNYDLLNRIHTSDSPNTPFLTNTQRKTDLEEGYSEALSPSDPVCPITPGILTEHEESIAEPRCAPQFSIREDGEEDEVFAEYENTSEDAEEGKYDIAENADGWEEEEQKAKETQNFQEMITIWNQLVQEQLNSGQEVYLTEKRQALLRQFLGTVFSSKPESSKLDAWKEYCKLIASSKFLTGKNPTGFKVNLDWALIPEKAYKILEGAIFDKPESISQGELQGQLQSQPALQSWEAFAEEIVKAHASSPYGQERGQEWLQISQHLARALGQTKYKSWFSKVYLGQITDTKAILYVEGSFTKAYIDNNFGDEILRAIQILYPTVQFIDFRLIPFPGGAK